MESVKILNKFKTRIHGVLILTDKSASYRIIDAAETNKDGSGVTTRKMQSARHQGG